MNDLKIIELYEGRSGFDVVGMLRLVSDSVSNNRSYVLNFEEVRKDINQVLRYLEIKQIMTFNPLVTLSYHQYDTYFSVGGNRFDNLEDALKAAKQKAFL